MIKIKLSDKEKHGLTNEEIEIAIARKLEILLLPILRRNINFFYAGANIPKKAKAYEQEVNLEDIEESFEKREKTIDATCKPLCRTVAEILNANGIHAETVSCDTDIFRHTDVLITTSSGKQYIINYLEDMEIIQTNMRTPDFASEQYYNRRYKKFEGTTTTDGKHLDNIAFVASERLEQIDENLGYKKYGMYMDDVVEQIRKEFSDFRNQMAINEFLEERLKKLESDGKRFSEEEEKDIKKKITDKWQQMSDDEILERKVDWIFEYFNSRGKITGHTDFVMYYSRLLLAKVLSPEEYKKVERFDCFIRENEVEENSRIKDVLDYIHQEDEKLRFCMIKIPNSSYVFSTKEGVYLKLNADELRKLEQEAKISKSEKPSNLILLLADRGNALPLVFNPMGQKIINERAEMEDQDGSDEKIQLLAKSIKCTDGKFADGKVTSMEIPYPDGSTKFIYIDENNELAEIQYGKKRIYHYDDNKEEFIIENIKTSGAPGENGVPGWNGESQGREDDL